MDAAKKSSGIADALYQSWKGSSISTAPRSGALMPPGQLGTEENAESNNDDDDANTSAPQAGLTDEPNPAIAWKRQQEAETTLRYRKFEHAASLYDRKQWKSALEKYSMLVSFCYEGMEVIFATSTLDGETRCFGIFARTQNIFQELSLPDSKSSIVAITACALTGILVVIDEFGRLQTYHPIPTDPCEVSHGDFLWKNGASFSCGGVFASKSSNPFRVVRNSIDPHLCVSISHNFKVLVTYHDQVAVLDVTTSVESQPAVASLLWMSSLPSPITTSKIAGNGNSFAVVLSRTRCSNDDDSMGGDGVHTFERDWNDGSLQRSDGDRDHKTIRLSNSESSQSTGIIYRPGQFLVHSAPVTRISFRGLGHISAKRTAGKLKECDGNDLMLTYCKNDASARIFTQHEWKLLIEWNTPFNSRVDWVRGIAALTLGDLETQMMDIAPQAKSQSRGKKGVDAEKRDVVREEAGSISKHSLPYSIAGAWLSEITFQGPLAAIRLSRLTYLRRGMDEANPTLFESMSAFLPPSAVFEEGILDTDDWGLYTQAIWPAWNPWLSEPVTTRVRDDTLRGSAMSFLGLSSGPTSLAGGSFGDSLLGGTQCPPTEIRLILVRPGSGRFHVIHFRVVGDMALLELSPPTVAMVSLTDLQPTLSTEASTTMDQHHLMAVSSGTGVDLIVCRPGDMSMLPSLWMPEDVDRTGDVLTNTNVLVDQSSIPAPIRVPLHRRFASTVPEAELEEAIHFSWWPCLHFSCEIVLLLVVMKSGDLVLMLVPPIASLFESSLETELLSGAVSDVEIGSLSSGDNHQPRMSARVEYDVNVIPDPDYGLGLRLESQLDSTCAVAGSFKKHPLTGEKLPVEKTGLVGLGDELISVNGVNLESTTFESIISQVREEGSKGSPGETLVLRFRAAKRVIRRNRSLDPNRRHIFEGKSTDSESSSMFTRLHDSTEEHSPDYSDMVYARVVNFVPREFCVSCRLIVAAKLGSIVSSDGDSRRQRRMLVHVENCQLVFSLLTVSHSDFGEALVDRQTKVSVEEKIGMLSLFSQLSSTECGIATHLQSRESVMLGKLSTLENQSNSVSVSWFRSVHVGNACEVEAFRWDLFACLSTSRQILRVWNERLCSFSTQTNQVEHHEATDVALDLVRDDVVTGFYFTPTGFLDLLPGLMVLTRKSVSMFLFDEARQEWIIQHKVMCRTGSLLPSVFQCPTLNATTNVPLVYRSAYESRFLADWHPEHMMALVCSTHLGCFSALQGPIMELLGEMNDLPHRPTTLSCLSASTIHASTTNKPEAPLESITNETNRIRKTSSVLLAMLSASNTSTSTDSKRELLRSLTRHEIMLLLLLIEVCEKLPSSGDQLAPGQLLLFSAALNVVSSKYVETKKSQPAVKSFGTQSVPVKVALRPQVASSSCVGALISENQEELVDLCRTLSGKKLNWGHVSELRMPFWIRSDALLAKVAEEIGQTLFRESREILNCALFFIIAKKRKMLRNLAATDQSISGKKFFSFLNTHDFTTERGRRAAEKNAFSLLRKCKYCAAAAFFLLPDPPFLTAAIETLFSKMEDPDLAFLISRLMESGDVAENSPGLSRGLGVVGGGGGYAISSGGVTHSVVDGGFFTWFPQLKELSSNLIVDRILPTSLDDSGFVSLLLMWLSKPEEARVLLSGVASLQSREGEFRVGKRNSRPPVSPENLSLDTLRVSEDLVAETLRQAKCMIDTLSSPLLLSFLEKESTVLEASKLQLAKTLMHKGCEVPARNVLLLPVSSSEDYCERDIIEKGNKHVTCEPVQSSIQSPPNEPSLSIFDSFVPPPPRSSPASQYATSSMQSSIFDSYTTPQPAAAVATMTSSIFDEFDVPSVSQQVTQTNEATKQVEESSNPSNVFIPKAEKKQLILSGSVLADERFLSFLRSRYLLRLGAQRLIREISAILVDCHGDPPEINITDFFERELLVPPGASSVLQLPCSGRSFKDSIMSKASDIADLMKLDGTDLLHAALETVGVSQPFRLLYSVLLATCLCRDELAEAVVRRASSSLLRMCGTYISARGGVRYQNRARSFSATQFLRRRASRLCWQLESCLWIHRGGGLPLSYLAVREGVCAIRVGLLVASWNKSFPCKQGLIHTGADCQVDERLGRHLWATFENKSREESPISTQTSGGWEFLVDCKRSQATEMLRTKPTGSFIIRPNSQDHSVFTLSFKTNLVPMEENGDDVRTDETPDTSGDEQSESETLNEGKKRVKKSDVVQHAIVRLSETGFRCGSFGPFSTLMSLLEAVSSSLPFKLRFDCPPNAHVIQDHGSQVSPNAVLLRKLASRSIDTSTSGFDDNSKIESSAEGPRQDPFGGFLEILILSSLRKQLCGIMAGLLHDEKSEYEDNAADQDSLYRFDSRKQLLLDGERALRTFLCWCKTLEVTLFPNLAPHLSSAEVGRRSDVDVSESMDAIEVSALKISDSLKSTHDGMLKLMISQDSGLSFSTLRLVDGGDCTVVLLFSKSDAIAWMVDKSLESSPEGAANRLAQMQQQRYIEVVDLSKLSLKHKHDEEADIMTYRIVDPWEVEPLKTRDAETQAATIGRSTMLSFSLGKVATAAESALRPLGGQPLHDLWTSLKGGLTLTKSLASISCPWDMAAGGDLHVSDEPDPSPFLHSVHEHLYRNWLFKRLDLPQRFVVLVQVEILDLKNLSSPNGSLGLTVYSLLRLKRTGHGTPLTNKARTIDTASSPPVKLRKATGPNAPASWGSVIRFRFPLPEDVAVDGTSSDIDREVIFNGPPTMLQLSVYEKKLLMDHSLGSADVSMEALWAGGQLEEWVPLRSEKHGVNWFTRLRLTLRFELMCLAPLGSEVAPSAGLRRIEELSSAGGATHEDMGKRTLSSPDLYSYLEGMVY